MEWKQARYRDFDLEYEVSEFGDVRRIAGPEWGERKRERPARILTPHVIGKKGYLQVILQHEGKRLSPLVHTLVAWAFLDPPPDIYGRGKIGVNHKDTDTSNNHYLNLEWATPQQNSDHAAANGLFWKGEEINTAKLTVAQVLDIRRRKAAGEGRNSLAREYEVSGYAIYAICIRKTWKHI